MDALEPAAGSGKGWMLKASGEEMQRQEPKAVHGGALASEDPCSTLHFSFIAHTSQQPFHFLYPFNVCPLHDTA